MVGKDAPPDATCPLCRGSNIETLESLSVAHIVQLYRRVVKIDVAAEFGDVATIRFCRCDDCDLRFFTPHVAGGERMYESLQRYPWYYQEDKDEYIFAAKYIQDQDSVLEIGCGKGAFGRHLKAREYVGLEFSAEAVRMAQTNGLTVAHEAVEEHACRNRGRYDVVCAFQVLEHVADCSDFITASLVCLRTGGLLIYSIPSADTYMALIKNNMLNMPPHHITCWSDQCLTRMAEIFDIQLVAIDHEPLADMHRRGYLIMVLLHSLLGAERLGHSIINVSLWYRILSKFAALSARLLERGLTDRRVRPQGHSVTVVYRKRN